MHKGYLCYDPLAHRLLTSFHVSFVEPLYFSSSSQDVYFPLPPDTPSVKPSRVPIDLIPLAHVVSILPADHFGTITAAIIPTPT